MFSGAKPVPAINSDLTDAVRVLLDLCEAKGITAFTLLVLPRTDGDLDFVVGSVGTKSPPPVIVAMHHLVQDPDLIMDLATQAIATLKYRPMAIH